MAGEGEKIENESFRIIESLIGDFPGHAGDVVKRVVHATADPSLAETIFLTEGAVEKGVNAVLNGKRIITDVEMVKAGINRSLTEKRGIYVECFMHEKEVLEYSRDHSITRARAAFRLNRDLLVDSVIAIGNAPTALFELCDLIEEDVMPALVIAAPVGFVGARDAKERILRYDVPCIAIRGDRGGSPIAASILNSILMLADRVNKT